MLYDIMYTQFATQPLSHNLIGVVARRPPARGALINRNQKVHLRAKAPHTHVPIVAARHNSVLPERKARHRAPVSDERRCAVALLARPDLDRAVVATAHEPELVARDGPHALDVPEERALDLAGLDVPHLDRVVEAARDEHRLLPLGAAPGHARARGLAGERGQGLGAY